MLNTNLLPPEQKENIRIEELRRLIIFFTVASLIIFLAGSLLLVPAYFGAALEAYDAERQHAIEEEAARKLSLSEDARVVSEVLRAIEAVERELDVSPKMSALAEKFIRVETGITVTSLIIKKNGEVSLTGQARRRRELLDFERSLRESGLFQEFYFPISNLIREADSSFSMQGTVIPSQRF